MSTELRRHRPPARRHAFVRGALILASCASIGCSNKDAAQDRTALCFTELARSLTTDTTGQVLARAVRERMPTEIERKRAALFWLFLLTGQSRGTYATALFHTNIPQQLRESARLYPSFIEPCAPGSSGQVGQNKPRLSRPFRCGQSCQPSVTDLRATTSKIIDQVAGKVTGQINSRVFGIAERIQQQGEALIALRESAEAAGTALTTALGGEETQEILELAGTAVGAVESVATVAALVGGGATAASVVGIAGILGAGLAAYEIETELFNVADLVVECNNFQIECALRDAGRPDAGLVQDAGLPTDAGALADAGLEDAGTLDDAGVDGGDGDGGDGDGGTRDAGPRDAGPPDADAGVDGGCVGGGTTGLGVMCGLDAQCCSGRCRSGPPPGGEPGGFNGRCVDEPWGVWTGPLTLSAGGGQPAGSGTVRLYLNGPINGSGATATWSVRVSATVPTDTGNATVDTTFSSATVMGGSRLQGAIEGCGGAYNFELLDATMTGTAMTGTLTRRAGCVGRGGSFTATRD